MAAVDRHAPGDKQGPWYPEERLSLAATIHAYTQDAAVAGGWQDQIGSLTPGKSADFVVLDRDLFALAADPAQIDAIAHAQVLLTVVAGAPVYHAPHAAVL